MPINKINPSNPDQFACDGCGRWFHHQVLEVADGHGEICTNCCVEFGIKPVSFPEQRMVDWKMRSLLRSLNDYNETVILRDAAFEKTPEAERPDASVIIGRKTGLVSILPESSPEVEKSSTEVEGSSEDEPPDA